MKISLHPSRSHCVMRVADLSARAFDGKTMRDDLDDAIVDMGAMLGILSEDVIIAAMRRIDIDPNDAPQSDDQAPLPQAFLDAVLRLAHLGSRYFDGESDAMEVDQLIVVIGEMSCNAGSDIVMCARRRLRDASFTPRLE